MTNETLPLTDVTARAEAVTEPGVSGARVAVEGVLEHIDVDVESLSVEEVRANYRRERAARAALDAWLQALDTRMRRAAVTHEGFRQVDPDAELCRHAGLRRREVKSLQTRAAAVDAAPRLGRLLAEGATTAGHVEAMGHALQIAGDGRDELLGHIDDIARRALTSSVDEFDRFMTRLARDVQPDEGISRFEQQRRRSYCRIWNDTDGMTRMSAAFDPERGAAIAGRLERHIEAMFHTGDRDHRDPNGLHVAPEIELNDHRRALALHALCTRTASRDGDSLVDTRPTRAEVIVHIDLQTLKDGLHRQGICRTSHGADIPPATARRIACDADIIPVVLDGRSVPIDVGRAKRLATIHQRRALETVHDTCAMPDCDVGFTRCVIHHLHPWEHGGPTDITNMVPLCNRHHHAVHDGGWTITLDPTNRTITTTPPGAPAPTPSPTSGHTPAHDTWVASDHAVHET